MAKNRRGEVMESYRAADIEQAEQPEGIERKLKTGASYAGAYLGAPLAARALPLLSKLIPENLMIKGLGLIDPRLSKYFKQGKAGGFTSDELRDFAKEELEKEAKAPQPEAESNPIKKYSPELDTFIRQSIASGKSPFQAGALARLQKGFSPIIEKMTQELKAPFSSILDTVYGGEKKGGAQAEQNQSAKMGLAELSSQILAELSKMRGT